MAFTEGKLSILRLHVYKNRFLHLILNESNDSFNQENLILSMMSIGSPTICSLSMSSSMFTLSKAELKLIF